MLSKKGKIVSKLEIGMGEGGGWGFEVCCTSIWGDSLALFGLFGGGRGRVRMRSVGDVFQGGVNACSDMVESCVDVLQVALFAPD